jgi:predicted nucleic acid-binding protein
LFRNAADAATPLYISSISVGELRRGVGLVRYRGDRARARRLEIWLTLVLEQFGENVLPFDAEAAQVWGCLRVPRAEHELDEQIAAIALVNDLTVVTRNVADFAGTGAKV